MNRMKFNVLFIILIIKSVTLNAQQYQFWEFGADQGLKSNDVTKIIQDSRGYLWATTMGNGIYRFNGNTFDNYTEKDGLGDNNTGSIVELPDGRLMILSLKCISIYDGLKFTNYTSKDGLALPGQWASTAFDKKGRLWIALWNADETRQLLYFENNRFHDITPVNPFLNAPESLLLSVVKNGDGDIIVNTLGNMYIVNDTVLNEYNPGVPAEVSENWLNLFYETADHTQFFLSFDAKIQKLSIFTLQNGVITYLDMPAEVGYWFLSGVCEDHENNLWVPSEFGLWRVSSNGEVKHFNEQNGLPIELVFWVTEDNENNIWLATRGLGLIKFMGEKFICLNEKDGLKSSKVYFNFKDSQGNIWFSTPTDQVCKFNGSEILYIDAPDNRETLGFFETNEHQVIVLTYQGLFDANSSNGYQLNNMFDLESDVIPYIAYNDGKYIWFSANGSSLIRFDGKTSAVVSAEEIGAEAGTILSITSDNIGNVWFAANAGYIKWDGKMYSYTTYPKNSISPDDIAVDKWNRVWIALYGGLLLVDTHGQRLLTTEDGLSSGYYVSLGFDNKGNMYAGYNQGFDLISFTQDGSVSSIKYYGKGDGFIGSSLGAQNINTDKKGNLYFATTQGLIRLDPSQLTPNTKPPIVNIRKIKLFYKDVNWESSEFRKFCDSVSPWFRLPVNLCLPYDKNHVTFEFEAICFTNPDAVKYQWMLQGLEKDWSPVSEQTKAEYANLEPGDYTFLVKACNNDGVWNNQPLAYRFTIKPPFWQTWWFIALAIAAVVTILAVIIRFILYLKYRKKIEELNKLKEIEKIRSALSKDIHDGAGASLSKISLLSESLKSEIKDSQSSLNKLTQISLLSRRVIDDFREIIWSTNPKYDNISSLLAYIRNYCNNFFEDSGIECDINFPSVHEEINISPLLRQNFFLILKEALHNIVKHASATSCFVEISLTENQIRLQITDNGIGFDLEQAGVFSTGIGNMNKRATACGGSITFDSAKNKGTTVTLIVPL
ncbi:MAG: hypothetical protein KBB11_00895 [Bacteroidales bacterium]|nr:hypothetical protein [Bacteroidales bacterium]HOY38035.1 two-component regulator propeller domain-containing protein [Bacteroidales bacterium]